MQEVGAWRGSCSLGDTGAADAWGAHLCEHLVQPLQGAVQVQLNPAGGAGHCLSPEGDNKSRGSVHSGRCFRFYWRADENKTRRNFLRQTCQTPLATILKTKTQDSGTAKLPKCSVTLNKNYKLSVLANI